MERRIVFVTGATGYLGRALIPALLARGHAVRALLRAGSESRLPRGCTPVVGDALSAATYATAVEPAHTFVHLVGTPSPAPWKERQFRAVDRASLVAALEAARAAAIAHFVYVSVAQPAPVMRAYVRVRAECEELVRVSRIRRLWPTVLPLSARPSSPRMWDPTSSRPGALRSTPRACARSG